MQLFLIIFIVILLIYFFLYFVRIRKKKSNDDGFSKETNEENSSADVNTSTISKSATHNKPILGHDEWVILKLVALKEKPYQGYEMMQTLLAEGLRFGQMNIFHRYDKSNEKLPVLFSLAQIAKPGTFDLNNIGTLECLGFTLFFSIKRVEDPISVLNLMVETANNIAEELGGKLYTQTHQLLTDEQLKRLYCNIKLWQEKLHTPDLFNDNSPQ